MEKQGVRMDNNDIEKINNTAKTYTLTGNYVLLRADETRLLLPQTDVGQAEYLTHESQLLPLEGSEGVFYLENHTDHFFVALSAHLKPQYTPPQNHFIATYLANTDEELRWCWHEVKILHDLQLAAHPLPEVVLVENSPVTHYVELEGSLAYPCTAEKLLAFALKEVAV